MNLTQLHTNVIPKKSLIPMGIVSVHPVTNGPTPHKLNVSSYLVVALRYEVLKMFALVFQVWSLMS